MIYLPTVKFPPDMHPAIFAAVQKIDALHRELTGSDATCTSAYRSQTPGGGSSLHPLKRALDLRTWTIGDQGTPAGAKAVRAFAAELRKRLGPDYDVIVEGKAAESPKYLTYANGKPRDPHIHVEYHPKPPPAAEPQADGTP